MEASPATSPASITDRIASRHVTRNEELYERARAVIPGGVDSPVRAFGSVGGTPLFAARGGGAGVEGAAGGRDVGLVQSWGALLFGPAHPAVVQAAPPGGARGTRVGVP